MDGIFVDKLSGVLLFDICDRFNLGIGWFLFIYLVKDSVIMYEDNSYGM